MNKHTGKQQKTIIILTIAAVLSVAVMFFALFTPKTELGEFVPPQFDENAVLGAPNAEEGLGFCEVYKDNMPYRFFVCGKPRADSGELTVYFTNPKENNAWLKMRVYSEDGSLLAESGIIKQGEYIKSLVLNKPVEKGESIIYKIMGYEAESYKSIGSVTLTSAIN